MKRQGISYLAGWAMLVALLSACQHEETDNRPSTDGGPLPMTFRASHPSTRATETDFELGDRIGVYMAPSDTVLQIGGNWLNNELLANMGGQWTATRTLYWPAEGTYTAYAYYPYNSHIESVTDQPFSVSLDQSTARTDTTLGGYEASDLLFATTPRLTATDKPVNLTFKHIMSRLKIRLIKGEDFKGEMPKKALVRIMGTVTLATIDLQSGVATRNMRGTQQTIITRQEDDYSYAAILVPQRIDNRIPLIEVVMDGVSYLYESRFVFKPGTEHLVNLVISTNPEQVRIDIGGEIENWQ